MQIDNVIEKARKLGLDVDNSDNVLENLEAIAEQVGMEDFSYERLTDLENILDSMLDDGSNQNEDALNNVISNNESLNDTSENIAKPQGKNKFSKNKKANEENNVSNVRESFGDKLRNLRKKNNVGLNSTSNNSEDKNFSGNDKLNNVKNIVKKRAKDKSKAALKIVGQKIKAFIIANPWVLLVLAGIIVVFLVLVLFFATAPEANGDGYYDSACNFNDTTINLKKCGGDSIVLNIEDYVMGMTYSYLQSYELSSESTKALMIILKTNALSKGGYNSSSKTITIDDCDKTYTDIGDISESELTKIKSLYSSVKDKLYISESYKSAISNLSSSSVLELNDDILNEMLDYSQSYVSILDILYNKNINVEEDEKNDENETHIDTMFVGDSRMNFMRMYNIVNNDNSVYAGAMGYYWFVGSASSTYAADTYNCKNDGIECVNDKIWGKPHNIVIWLGANDPDNAAKYYNKYYELASGDWKNNNIYVVSVGYVDDSRSEYVQNNQIDEFNKYMQEKINGSGLNNLKYLDLGFDAKEMADGTIDGVHYGDSFSKQIYNKILGELGNLENLSERKSLYNLGDYCTFYNITENDAYWWPIGSKSPTKGDIYGGTPMPTTITSTFGPREIAGTSDNHGALDIAGPCNDTVVVATKDGTVVDRNDSCDNNGGYGNTCGVGFGNYVMIDHGDGMVSIYGHMYPNSVTIKVGDQVKQGQKLGVIGNSGSSTGCHLHFEMQLNNVKVDPLEYVSEEYPRPAVSNNFVGEGDPNNGKQYICKSLLKSGYSKNATIGIMINIAEESGFISQRIEGDFSSGYTASIEYTKKVDSGQISKQEFVNKYSGYGFVQWTAPGRKQGLYEFAKSKNKSIGDPGMQIEYFLHELQQLEPGVYKKVTGNYSAFDVATEWCDWFERPAGAEACLNYGNCPSPKCSGRANQFMNEMTNYVNNGCK